GLSELSSEYSSFHDGLVDYTEGVHALAMNYEDLDSGIQGLSEGTSELDSGAHELSEGTKELESSTHDIPEEMQSEIDELMDEYENEDFEPVSFVSDQNKDVGVVQFVLQTESIEIEEPEENDETSEDELSFWDRLLDLFRQHDSLFDDCLSLRLGSRSNAWPIAIGVLLLASISNSLFSTDTIYR